MTVAPSVTPCAQCGLPAGGRPSASGEGPFCCTGCALASYLGARFGSGGTDRLLARVILSAFLAMGTMAASLVLYGDLLPGGDEIERTSSSARALSDLARAAAFLFTAPVVWLLGVPLIEAVVRGRRWLSTESLVLAGTGAAITASVWNTFAGGPVWYESATLVLVLVGLGRWLDARARERAREGLGLLAPKSVQPATKLTEAGEESVEPSVLAIGDRVRVRPGEVLPVDAIVIQGRAFLDQAALTGEAEPRAVRPGERVLAGSSVLDGTLIVRAEAVGAGRLRAEIERVLAQALSRRARHVDLADRVAAVLVPLAGVLALVAGFLRGSAHGLEEGVRTVLAVVLISCPCALGIATPLAFWAALGTAWRRGILVRGADVLERLARVRRVFFDKTGTLIDRELVLERVLPRGALGEQEALRLAASVEAGSEHPIARAIARAFAERGAEANRLALAELRVLPGIGVEGVVDGRRLVLRRAERGDDVTCAQLGATIVVLEEDGRVQAELHLSSHLRPDARLLVDALRRRGTELALLTGDLATAAEPIARALAIPAFAELLPHQKVELIERAGARDTLYVGDGLNDSAALAAAGVGIAVAGSSPRSVEVADVTLLGARISSIAPLLDLARAALRTARFNLFWAFAYNTIGLWMAATGRLTPVWAALAMVLSSASVVLCSTRAARVQDAEFDDGARPAQARRRSDPAPPFAPVRATRTVPARTTH